MLDELVLDEPLLADVTVPDELLDELALDADALLLDDTLLLLPDVDVLLLVLDECELDSVLDELLPLVLLAVTVLEELLLLVDRLLEVELDNSSSNSKSPPNSTPPVIT